MADNVIKEFLVSIGFTSDGVDEFSSVLEAVNKQAAELAKVIGLTAVAVGAAVAKMASDFDTLYWQSRRLGSSATEIKSFSYAISQMGGSVQGAQSALENVAEFVRANPGAGGWLGALGLKPEIIGNTKQEIDALSKSLSAMPYYQANQYAGVLGIDSLTLQALRSGDLKKYEDQYVSMSQRVGRAFGINMDDATGKSHEFIVNLRLMKAEAGLALDFISYRVLQYVLPALESIPDAISSINAKIGDLKATVKGYLDDLKDGIKDVAKWFNGLTSDIQIPNINKNFVLLIEDVKKLGSALMQLAESPAMKIWGGVVMAVVDQLTRGFMFLISVITSTIGVITSVLDHSVRGLSALIMMAVDAMAGNWKKAAQDAIAVGRETLAGVGAVAGAPGAIAAGLTPASPSGGAPATPASSGTGSGSSALSPMAAIRSAGDYFSARMRSAGFSSEQIRGIAAGIKAEGGGIGMAANGAFGIGQWRGPRQRELFERYGNHPSLSQQIEFLIWELRGGDRGGRSVTGETTAAGAMVSYLRDFMRPGNGLAGDLHRGFGNLGMPTAHLGVSRGGVTLNQQTTIHVNGSNAHQIGNDVAGAQDSVNQRLVANAGVFLY